MPKPGLSFVWNNRGLGPIVLPCTPSRKVSPLGRGLAHECACLQEGIYGQGWQGHPRQPVLPGSAWALLPVGSSAGEFPSGRGGCLRPFLLIFLAVTQGFQELEG